MKILIVNTYDRGGAANACYRLFLGLKEKKVTIKILLAHKEGNWENSYEHNTSLKSFIKQFSFFLTKMIRGFKVESKIKYFLTHRNTFLEWFSFPNSKYDITNSKLYEEADIINLHWVAGFIDYTTFFKKNKKPIVWTLHDMNPFSGGEHYTEKFLGINTKGFPIKRELTSEEILISKENIEIKKKAIASAKSLHIVAPSKWLADAARESIVFKALPIHYIPYGLCGNTFSPREKEMARKRFNIPEGKKVILFVADSIDKDRKGFVFLQKAFELLNNEDIILCSIGGHSQAIKNNNQYIPLGIIKDEMTMSYAYSAADVFVIPSLMDNLPNTVLESLMCGTPVIGFPVGGIIDMVQHGKNGYITEDINVPSLLKTLHLFLAEGENFDTKQIRKDALSKYDQNNQAEKYLQLFKAILNKESR